MSMIAVAPMPIPIARTTNSNPSFISHFERVR